MCKSGRAHFEIHPKGSQEPCRLVCIAWENSVYSFREDQIQIDYFLEFLFLCVKCKELRHNLERADRRHNPRKFFQYS